MIPDNANTHPNKNERLIQISRSLNTITELIPFLQHIVDVACELTLSETSAITLHEEETNCLKYLVTSQSKLKFLERTHIPTENSIAGKAFIEARPITINNSSSYQQIFLDQPQIDELEMHSMLVVPLIYGEKTIGTLETVNKQNLAHYTEDDIKILETLASYAAIEIFLHLLLEESRQSNESIQQFERTKSDFIAITSHELRTPLGLVIGHATLLKDIVPDLQAQQSIDVILRSAEHLKKLIDNLDRMKVQSDVDNRSQKKPININEIIGYVTNEYKSTAKERKISLFTRYPKEDLYVFGDPEKIFIALSNLVNNALSFTEQNGRILISADEVANYIKVSVIDSGIGIPTKDIEHIFERFYQVESHSTRKHGGMGLGLSVAKVMVESHGGEIWAESIEGKGSNFSFLLPIFHP